MLTYFPDVLSMQNGGRDESARFTTIPLALQKLWARVCRFKYDIGKNVAEVTVLGVKSRHQRLRQPC